MWIDIYDNLKKTDISKNISSETYAELEAGKSIVLTVPDDEKNVPYVLGNPPPDTYYVKQVRYEPVMVDYPRGKRCLMGMQKEQR